MNIFNRSYLKGLLRRKVVKDFGAIVGSNLLLRPVQLIKGFVVAKYLGPADYGLLKSVELIQMLSKYGSLGFNTAAAREAGNAIGDNNSNKLKLVRNTAYSSEIILSLFLFLIGITSTIFFESREISLLIVIASFGLLASKLRAILATEATISKKFILISKVTLITVSVASVIVIVTVPFLKIYAVLLTNFLIGVLAIILYLRFLKFRMQFKIQREEFQRILKISIPLAFNTLSLAAFKYSERILLLAYLGEVALGVFSFALMVVDQISIIFKASIKVRIQDIFEGLGNNKYKRIHRMVLRETLLLGCSALIIIPIAWLMLEYFIPLFLPKWEESIIIGQLLLFSLPFYVILNYPNAVLISALVNKQSVLPIFRFGSAGLLIIGTILLKHLDILDLKHFVYLNVACLAYYNIVVLMLYKVYFINPYIIVKNK
jgi:O-antigen/teichoic acid export membrane protein